MPILAMGGFPDEVLRAYLVGLADVERPRLLYVPTASGEDAGSILAIHEQLGPSCDVAHATFFPWPPEDLRERALAADIVLVGGGNTANMLAVWRVHGFDEVLREAWRQDVVLAGWSAGAICWFEAGVTDSFGPQLEQMECLGFLPGSACPHYDGEELRRPRYGELLRDGLPPGVAIDDDVGVRFDGTELKEVVTSRAGATAYRVGADGQEALDARLLR
jgi:dipeptidase E